MQALFCAEVTGGRISPASYYVLFSTAIGPDTPPAYSMASADRHEIA
jgi:hypothetical protein